MIPLWPWRDSWRTWLGYAALLAALSWLCFGSLRHHQLDTHDDLSFQDHLRIDQDWTFFFSPDKAQASGRPFAEAVKYGAYLLWGNDPAAFHLLVVAFHTLASLLLARVCRRLGLDLELSLLSGLLFLVNVTHFQAIHHISALDYPLSLGCALLSLLAYLDYLEGASRRAGLRFILYLLLGLMAHLSAVAVVPFVLFHRWRQGREWHPRLRQFLAFGGLLILALAGLLAITSRQTSAWWSFAEYGEQTPLSLAAGMGRVLLWFVSRLLTTAHWLPLPIYARQPWELYLGGALLAGLLVGIWKQVWPAWVWAAWLLLWLAPFLLLTETTVLDLPTGPSRYLYAASAGSSALLAWLLREGTRRLGRVGNYLFPLLLLATLFSSFRSLRQTEALSLYSSGRFYIASGDMKTGGERLQLAIARGPGIIDLEDAYVRLGMVLLGTGEFAPYLQAARRAFPENSIFEIYQLIVDSLGDDPARAAPSRARLQELGQRRFFANLIARSYYNLGRELSLQGAHQQAIPAYEHSLQFAPDRVKTLKELGFSLLQLDEIERAVEVYQRAIAAAPRDYQALYGGALARQRQGDLEGAIALSERGLQINPGSQQFGLLAYCLEQAGRWAEARAVYQRGLAQHPEDGQLHLQLGRNLLESGDPSAAVQALEQAARRLPPTPALYRELGDIYFREQRFADAAAAYQNLLRLEPADAAAWVRLGDCQRELGDLQEAETAYQRAAELRR